MLDIEKGKIAVSILMPAFAFKKDLMHEHFNESYIKSDLYPKANFTGQFIDFNLLKMEENKALIVKETLEICIGQTRSSELKIIDKHYLRSSYLVQRKHDHFRS